MPRFLFAILLLTSVFSRSQADLAKASELFAQKRYAEAKSAYLDILESRPNQLVAVERLGDLYSFSKQWTLAVSCYAKLVAAQPENAGFHYKLGAALAMDAASGSKWRAVGMLSDIRNHLERAVALDPGQLDARWALVEYYLQVPGIFGGSESKANRYADEMSKISSVDHYLAKGRIAEYFDRYDLAEKHYLKAHAIGNSKTTLAKLTSVYAKMKRPDKAKAVTERFRSSEKTSEKSTQKRV